MLFQKRKKKKVFLTCVSQPETEITYLDKLIPSIDRVHNHRSHTLTNWSFQLTEHTITNHIPWQTDLFNWWSAQSQITYLDKLLSSIDWVRSHKSCTLTNWSLQSTESTITNHVPWQTGFFYWQSVQSQKWDLEWPYTPSRTVSMWQYFIWMWTITKARIKCMSTSSTIENTWRQPWFQLLTKYHSSQELVLSATMSEILPTLFVS